MIAEMKSFTGSDFITARELATYMGYKRTVSVKAILSDLPKANTKYFIPDVAERMTNGK